MTEQPGDVVIVAIDGPSGVGKSTTSRLVAERLGIPHIDTGAMYRAVALNVIEAGLSHDDEPSVLDVMSNTEIRFERLDGELRVFSGDEDVTRAIRTPEVSMAASDVSKLSGVRRELVDLQRRIGRTAGGVLEGRDIGTKVFPDTPHKFFLTADPRIRAERRWGDLADRGSEMTVDEILAEQTERDEQDSTRSDSPLTCNETYTRIDTSNLSIDEVVELIVARVRQR